MVAYSCRSTIASFGDTFPEHTWGIVSISSLCSGVML